MARNDNSIETIQKTLDLAGQELRILHQISQSISATLDLDQVLRQIVDLVIDVTHGDACLIYLLDESADNLVLRASKKRGSIRKRCCGRARFRRWHKSAKSSCQGVIWKKSSSSSSTLSRR